MKSTKEWISISDMMTGLMMVFLFISISFMSQIQKESEERIKDTKESAEKIKKSSEKIKKLTQEHMNYKVLILNKLKEEFQKDLRKWDAEIIEDSLVIRFLSPDIMFNPMESLIKKKFKGILNDFCPRYFKLLYEFQKGIEEIRIEGHTSDEWQGLSKKEAYFKNMKLSQDRTRSVLNYCAEIQSIEKNVNDWIIETLTANGLSSSRPRCKESTTKCRSLNRRVEFRIQINESSVLYRVIKEVENIFQQSIFEVL